MKTIGGMRLKDFTEKELRFLLETKIPGVREVIDNLVILEEDENGRYIRYAFKEGQPDHPRCLSWYDKPQPKAWIRNWSHNWNTGELVATDEECIERGMFRLKEIGNIYRLSMFSCGNQDNPDPSRRCCPGHPKEECLNYNAKYWTEEEPVKCACWYLLPINKTDLIFNIPLQELVEDEDFGTTME